MQKKQLLILVLMLQIAFVAQAQRYSKLEVKSQEVFEVAPDNMLVVDTLIMQDDATIKFSPFSKGMLGVRIAYIGEDCSISAKGADGEDGSLSTSGSDGTDGVNLEIDIHFMTLGSLAIDTRGGNGGDGYIGKSGGKPQSSIYTSTVSDGKGGFTTVSKETEIDIMTQGEQGTPPGTGGNGGNIVITYSTNKFIPNFNHNPRKSKEKKEHLIEIAYEAGSNGDDGRNGSYYIGRKTKPISGTIVTKNHPTLKNGEVKLVNANKPL